MLTESPRGSRTLWAEGVGLGMDRNRSAAISTVALAMSVIVIMVGSVLFDVGQGATFNSFLQTHPFDLLTVSVWYSGGAWLLGFARNLWGAVGLIYGLGVAALVCLLAVNSQWWTALEWSLGIATLIAIVVCLILTVDGPPPSGGAGGGGRLPAAIRSDDALLLLAAAAALSLYYEYNATSIQWLPFTGLVLAEVGTVIVSRLIQTRGYTRGRIAQSLSALIKFVPLPDPEPPKAPA
jgi:hypothetical protein